MRFPLDFTLAQASYQAAQKRKGRKRYPTVLMLEPLYTCNLACLGCSTERHTGKLSDRLPLKKCLKAAEDVGVPIVAVCGGEPTLYPELPDLVSGLIGQGRFVILCTNGQLLDTKFFGLVPPHRQLFVNVHLDGMRETHDYVCNRQGVWDKAVEMIRESKERGHLTLTNSTIYKDTDMEEVERVCDLLTDLKVDGILISPGYQYEDVQKDVFLGLEQIHEKFRRVLELSRRYRLTATPAFLEFAAGLRDLECSPYSTVNYTPMGWKGPCYLLGDSFYEDFQAFWDDVDWAFWETRQDRRCANCKMHSGFEHSAVEAATRSLAGLLRLAAWHVSG